MAITIDDIKRMSPMRKALIICLIFLLLGYFYYSYFYKDALEKKCKLAERLSSLQQEIAEKQIVVKQIEKYRKELAVLEESLREALTRLPEQKEIPGLLNSVSESGREEALEFLLFEPADPVSRDFYVEIPIKIEVSGNYHSVVLFFEKVAKLHRIMNITDISIKRREKIKDKKDALSTSKILSKSRKAYLDSIKDKEYTLVTSCLIKTYMFLEKMDEEGVAVPD